MIRSLSSAAASRTACSEGSPGAASASRSRSLRSFSGTGRNSSVATPSRRTYSRSHAAAASSSPLGSGFPAPGRFSKAPRSVASAICCSIHVLKLMSGGLRSVMPQF
jgi:hypothetical protein